MNYDQAIFAMYHSDEEVNSAVNRLRGTGIGNHGFLVVHADHLMTEDRRDELHTDIVQGSMIGAGVGAACGVLLALSFDKLPLMLPVTLNMLTLTFFCTVFGLIFGAGSGALIGIGTPEPLCRRYSRYLAEGDVLLAVLVPSPELKATIHEAMDQSGGFEIAYMPRSETLRRISRHFVNPSFFRWAKSSGRFTFSEGSALKILGQQVVT